MPGGPHGSRAISSHALAATVRADRVSVNAIAEPEPAAERLLAYTRLKEVRVAL